MGAGNQAEATEEEDLQMGLAMKTRIQGWGLKWKLDLRITDLSGSGLLLAVQWTVLHTQTAWL